MCPGSIILATSQTAVRCADHVLPTTDLSSSTCNYRSCHKCPKLNIWIKKQTFYWCVQTTCYKGTKLCRFGYVITFKVFHRLHPQLLCCIFITHEDSLRMLLKRWDRPHMIYTFFYGFIKGKGFVCTSNKNHHLT